MARVALCQDTYVEYMGYMYISAVLKKAGHTVEVFIDDQGTGEAMIRELRRFKPDIVGFSLLSPTVPWALSVAKRIKEEIGAITIAGNIHPIINPQIIEEDGFDIVCLTEGELLMEELARRVDRKESYSDIDGFWVKTSDGIIKNRLPESLPALDTLPFHDRDLYDKYFFFRKSKYLRFLSGRGCPYRCTFCANAFLLDHYRGKKYLRKCSVARAMSELEYLVKKRKPEHIFFVDEVFWISDTWLREFSAAYQKKIGLPFTANFRYGKGISESDLKMLKEAGLEMLIIPIESADEKQRLEILNKRMRDTEIFQVTDLLKKHQITFSTSAFFGLPGESVERHIDQLALYRKIKPNYLWTTFFQPYPGIKLTQLPEVQSFIDADKSFSATCHQEMPLDLPNKVPLENLKKVYFLMMIWPRSVPLWRRIIRWRARLLFDMLFMLHFANYAFKFEHVSFLQYLFHLKVFGWNILFQRKR